MAFFISSGSGLVTGTRKHQGSNSTFYYLCFHIYFIFCFIVSACMVAFKGNLKVLYKLTHYRKNSKNWDT